MSDKQIDALKKELDEQEIETILSRIRALSRVIGKTAIHDLDGAGYEQFGKDICTEIGRIVNVRLPKRPSACADLVSWITGVARDYPIFVGLNVGTGGVAFLGDRGDHSRCDDKAPSMTRDACTKNARGH